MNRKLVFAFAGLLSAAFAASVALGADKKDDKEEAVAHVKPAEAAPKGMKITGTVKFEPAEHGLKVIVDLKGFKPNSVHGFHIHEKGDLSSPDLKSAGGHFNPTGKNHGGPDGAEHHAGDLGNITADKDGNVKETMTVHGISLNGEKAGIVGRSVIVHEKADDLKTNPAGDSGARVAGGKIEMKEEKK